MHPAKRGRLKIGRTGLTPSLTREKARIGNELLRSSREGFQQLSPLVSKVAQLLAKGDYVCVLLGDGVAVATTWDDSDISAIARKVKLEPREDGSLIYVC